MIQPNEPPQASRLIGVSSRIVGLAVLAAAAALFPGRQATAEDWPTFRHDRLRTGVSGEKLPVPLEQAWVFRSLQSGWAKRPAADPNWTSYPESVRFNVPLIAAAGCVFFTSSEDGRIVCLDAATGAKRWQFVAGAGMNRCPTFHEGRVFCGSNDGHAYCLDAQTGAVVWVYKAAPADRWLFRYGRPISAWPVMSDVAVDRGVAYCASGCFPHDGAFLDCFDAQTGTRFWRSGRASENAWRESLAPGGHLFVTQEHVWVPKDFRGFSGIAYGSGVPFRRSDGRFLGGWGGPDPEQPDTGGTFWPLIGAKKDGIRYAGNAAIQELVEPNKRERKDLWRADIPGRWIDGDSAVGVRQGGKGSYPLVFRYDPDSTTTILAGDTMFVLALDSDPAKGVGGGVYARDPASGEIRWSAEIPERPNQLAVADGRLFVATQSGTIYCFAPQGAAAHGVVQEAGAAIAADPAVGAAADAIMEQSGVREGYALVVDCEDGHLAAELATRGEFYVCAVFRDAERMMQARAAFVAAGLHVRRIVTWLQQPGGLLPYPSCFADLVVSEAAVAGRPLPEPPDLVELQRLTKPRRGVLLVGGGTPQEQVTAWAERAALPGGQVVSGQGSWAKWVRPPLEDAGGWTHAYADPGQTACSHDGVLKPPLGVVWYGGPKNTYGVRQMPLVSNGVFVNTEKHMLEGYDQYTGRLLWRVKADGIAADDGQVACSDRHVYSRYQGKLVQLDLLTGKEIATYNSGFGAEHPWGWFAISPDGGTIYGAAGGGLFATEADSGQGNVLWKIGGPAAAEGDKIGAMLMEGGRIYSSGPAPTEAEKAELVAAMRQFFATQPQDLREEFEKQIGERDYRTLVAVEAATGKILYRKAIDVTNAGGKWLRPAGYGMKKGYNPYVMGHSMAHDGVVVFGTTAKADKGWSVWYTGAYNSRALTGYDGVTGKFLWYTFGNYRARPLIVGDTVHAEPWAYDLKTGRRKTRKHPISGLDTDWAWARPDKQCGVYSASKHFLFGRSMGLGIQDLLTDQGLYTFWHSRGSCWMDCTSGGGTMIKPPASRGCVCQWNMPFTIALGTVPTQPTSAPVFAAPGPALPVKHLHLDFAGTGDRRDAAGNMWLRLGMFDNHPLFPSYPIATEMYEQHDAIQRSAIYTPIEGTDVPFVFATAQIGLKKAVLPIAAKDGSGGGRFLVRLGFVALPGEQPGQRVFDVKLNGRTVLENFDPAKEAGRPDLAIWKEFPLDLADALTLELAAKSGAELANLPTISGLQVLRQ